MSHPSSARVQARTCEFCGKPLSVTWYRAVENGVVRSVRAHLKCFTAWRKTQAGVLAPRGQR